MINKLKIALLALLFATASQAQELNCNIQVNSDKIIGSNKSVFNTLQKSISEFVKNRHWTEQSYTNIEKIECTMNIIVSKVEGDVFTAEIQIQSRRPVYNSSYNSTLFNFRDNEFTFEYKEFDQLEMQDNVLTSNLIAVLAYYSYIIIGYDMDTYSRLGGTPYFQQAESVVNAAQSAGFGSGWEASMKNSKNRYALANNLNDEAFKKFRSYYYEYHRLGLDEMSINMTNARAKIAAGLPVVRDANRSRPSAIIITTFIDAKTDELVNIFSKATDKEKKDVVQILSDVDPAKTDRFEKILQK